ncbi:MAG: two-component system response regulator, partial [Candidatus Gastranaerophilaceae bacterium]
DRLMLPASGSVAVRDYNAEVLIMEPDKALSFLLETIAQMKGYSVKTAAGLENVKDFSPAVIILDTGDMSEFDGCEICSRIKKSSQFEKSFIIMTSIIHDKEKVLKCGADMYVPKPYDTAYLFEQTEKAVKEYNS